MERERYDGADVIHILHTRGPKLDWTRLVDRFSDNWRILLLNLVLYGFVYPGEESPAPQWVMDTLLTRLRRSAGRSSDGRSDLRRDVDLPGAVSRGHSRVGI